MAYPRRWSTRRRCCWQARAAWSSGWRPLAGRIPPPMSYDDIQYPTRHHPLREDIRALAQLMDEVLREQGGAELWQLVEQDRLTAIRWREGVAGCGEALAVRVRGRPP